MMADDERFVVLDTVKGEHRQSLRNLREVLEAQGLYVVEERVLDELRRKAEKLEQNEAEMRRLGYGAAVIYCFDERLRPICTSQVGDRCWDTLENKHRTYAWIAKRCDEQHRLKYPEDALQRRAVCPYCNSVPCRLVAAEPPETEP